MNLSTSALMALLLTTGSMMAQTEEKENPKTTEKERPFQLTFVTPVGTNGMECMHITNNVSINLFAGANGGLKGIEMGGFANVIKTNVQGAQFAGFTNVVLKNVKGGQFAGFCNYSGGSFLGGAFAGFANVNKDSLSGAQFAGFVNTNGGPLTGAQFAGFANANLDSLKGAQLAGFCNYNRKSVTGWQASGFANVATGRVKGAQLAGFANVATGDLSGTQVAGFLNYAKRVKGVQLGFINVADSVDGAPIGFLNIVKHGLHQLEFSADELFYADLGFRTGTQRFYNVFSAGASPKNGNLLWHIGYGVGTSFGISPKLRAELGLSAHHVSSGLFFHGTSELYKVYMGVEYKLNNKLFIAGGPTFNLYFSDALLPSYDKTYSGAVPYSLLNETNTNGFNFKAWVGGKIAIRFF